MRTRLIRSAIAAAIALAVLPVAPASAGGGGHCGAATTIERTTTVVMSEACYFPTIARVPAGSTVTWVNKDPFGHTVTGANLVFGNGDAIGQDGSMRSRFARPGVYAYYCMFHAGMAGVIVVGSDSEVLAALGNGGDGTARNISSAAETATVKVRDERDVPTSSWPVVAALIGLGSVGLGFGVGRRNRNGHVSDLAG